MRPAHFAAVRWCIASALLAASGLAPTQARAQLRWPTTTSLLAQTTPVSPAETGMRGARVGITRRAAGPEAPRALIMLDSVTEKHGSRTRHVLIGTLVGGLAGGVIGGATSAGDTGTSLDPNVKAASVLGGMLVGALVGGLVGVFWPHS